MIMKNKLLELLTDLYSSLESEHLDMGYDVLKEHIEKYPEFKEVLEKIKIKEL